MGDTQEAMHQSSSSSSSSCSSDRGRRLLLLLLGVLLGLPLQQARAQLQWEAIHDGNHTVGAVPDARLDAGLAYDPGRNVLVLFGGKSIINGAQVVLGDTWIFELNQKTWREVKPPTSPQPRFSFVSGFTNDYMYVATGEGPNQIHLNDIWRFSMRNEEWEELPAQNKPDYYTPQQWTLQSRAELKPTFRQGSVGGVFPNSSRFYVSQGCGQLPSADTFSYSIYEKGWYLEYPDLTPYNPSYPHGRCLHAGTMLSPNELLIFGGCLTGSWAGGPCPSGDAWIFNGKTKEWTQLDNCASPRNRATLAMLPSKGGHRRAVLYGGEEKTKQVLTTVESEDYQVAVFNPDTRKWVLRATQGSIPSKRASVAMATGRHGIYMFGGVTVGTTRLYNDVHLLRGDADSADKAPVAADCHPTFFSLVTLHGILMVLGWGFFLQWGAFVARYMDHNRALWFHLHRLFQVFGLLLAIAGFVCAVVSVQAQSHFTFTHAIVGLVVMVLGVLQPINALLRPKPPAAAEDPSVQCLVWRFFHTYMGRAALALAVVNVSLGLFLAVSSLLLWALWFAYLGVLVLSYLIAECKSSDCDATGRRAPSPGASSSSAAISAPASVNAPRSGGKYILRDRTTNGLFGDKHHAYDNAALESEG